MTEQNTPNPDLESDLEPTTEDKTQIIDLSSRNDQLSAPEGASETAVGQEQETTVIQTGESSTIDQAAAGSDDLSLADVKLPRKKKKVNKFWAVVKYMMLIVIAVSLVAGTQYLAFRDRIQPSIKIGDVPVGGLNKDQAENRLIKEYREALKKPVILTYRDKEKQIIPSKLQTRIFFGQTVDLAYEIGREDSVIESAKVRIQLLLHGRTIMPRNDFNEEQLKDLLRKYVNLIDIPKVEATIEIKDHNAFLVESRVGEVINKTDLHSKIVKEMFMTRKTPIEVIPRSLKPRVTTSGAQQAFKDAGNILKSKITLIEENGPFKAVLTSRDVESSLIFTEAEEPPVGSADARRILVVGFDSNEMTEILLRRAAPAIREPRDATFSMVGGVLRISSSDNGRTVDAIESSEKILEAAKTGAAKDVPLVFVAKIPNITTEQAQSFGIKEKISTFTTNYDQNYAERVNNIVTLSKALSGTIVEPGKTFSFNEVIGPRTAEKGYQEASVIMDGKLLPALGGGVCQVSTTLFNAVFFAGLKVDERHNHSFYISKYPPGRDATVSYPNPDLAFTNDLSTYILIQVTNGNGAITVDLYSTKTKREVFLKSSGFSNIVPFITSTINDASLEAGKSVVREAGIEGRRITITRTVNEGGKVIHNDTFSSYYVPKNQVLAVGTMPSETTTTTTTLSTTTTTVPTTTTTTLPSTTTTFGF